MPSQNSSLSVYDVPGRYFPGGPVSEEWTVVQPRDKADLLALRLLVDSQPEVRGLFPYVLLFGTSQREEGMGQLILGEGKKDVGLVLLGILAPLQEIPSPRSVILNHGIVSGRDVGSLESPSLREEGPKFYLLVAEDTRIGCPGLKVLLTEVGDHLPLELLS